MNGPDDFPQLLEALDRVGSITAAVPDLAHLDGRLPILGEAANMWETVIGQFWEMVKPA